MKKIAIFFYVSEHHGTIKLGGAERRMSRILDELMLQGFEAHVILKVNKHCEHIKEMYQDVLKHKLVKINQVETYMELAKLMNKERYDWILYTDSYKAMVPFVLLGKLINSKCLMLNVTTYTSELKFNSIRQKLLFEFIVKLSDQLDVLYPSGFDRLKEKYKNKIITLTPGAFTDINLFYPKEKRRKIVFLSSLIENKNPELFVDSIYTIREELFKRKYTVELCGTGPLQREIESKIKNYDCDELITITGNVLPQDVLPEAEVFISIQNHNNYPSQALLEAISSGCFIVASNEGDTEKIVKKKFGFLSDLSAKQIGKKILEYISKTDEEKKKIIEDARSFAESEFTIDMSVNHYKYILK